MIYINKTQIRKLLVLTAIILSILIGGAGIIAGNFYIYAIGVLTSLVSIACLVSSWIFSTLTDINPPVLYKLPRISRYFLLIWIIGCLICAIISFRSQTGIEILQYLIYVIWGWYLAGIIAAVQAARLRKRLSK